MLIKKITNSYQLGKMNSLEVMRFMPQGAYLKISDSGDEILLPKRYLPHNIEIGDMIDVFVYHDNEGRLTATTLKPFAEVGQTKLLKCNSCSDVGAFLSWGIHKDILVPFAEQYEKMVAGESYVVHLYIDNLSGKIVASAKLNKHIGNTVPDIKVGEEVNALVVDKNDVGFRTVVNDIYWGIIYYDQVDRPLSIGREYKAYLVRTRDDDKLDLSINPVGYSKVELIESDILKLLESNDGCLLIGDKSSAEDIKKITGLSKKTFKMVIGSLYKKGIVTPYSYEIKMKDNKTK